VSGRPDELAEVSPPVWRSRLYVVAGVAMVIGASLSLALGLLLFFLTFVAAPFAILQAIAGLRLTKGRMGWLWIGIPCALGGWWLGAAFTDGIAAPIGWASVAVNLFAIVAALVAAAMSLEA
jgi:hypothetical protein